MPDMLKVSKEEDQRKRDEAKLYGMQQQIDELRRQMKENLARQQWFEELYRQSEGKVTQVLMAQDRMSQDVSQHLSAREIGEGRMKAQMTELAAKIDLPEKLIRELRAQIQEVNNAIRADRDGDQGDRRLIEDLQRQIREINSAVALIGDGQRQMRDIIHELDSAIGEVRQEALHVAEMQRMEEQRLRRQGVELQQMFEALRQQFTDVSAKSQRVDDVRRQLVERIEAVEEILSTLRKEDESTDQDLERIEKTETDHYLLHQQRLETIRMQLDEQLAEMRQMNDQRMDRYTSRFQVVDERLRAMEQALSEIPSRFEALEQRDETIGAEADTIEEWLVMRQLSAMETLLDEVRKRRVERGPVFKSKVPGQGGGQGSVYNPAGLIKSVKDARPPTRRDNDDSPSDPTD